MTKQEAIQAMRESKRLTHRYFSDGEWVTQYSNGKLITEDGVKHNAAEFWSLRTAEGWQTDWEIFKDPER